MAYMSDMPKCKSFSYLSPSIGGGTAILYDSRGAFLGEPTHRLQHSTLVVPTTGGATTQSTQAYTQIRNQKCLLPLLLLGVTWKKWLLQGFSTQKAPKKDDSVLVGVSLKQQFVPPCRKRGYLGPSSFLHLA
jgi:hypothetical protein